MQVTTSPFDVVRAYYGSVLKTNKDLQTSACCSAETMPAYLRAILATLDTEILDTFYGCGAPIPLALEGCTVLDLGCGSGRDAYLVSRLVGPQGFVIGLDMTQEQLAIAQRHLDSQMQKFGYTLPNLSFRQGYIEDLHTASIPDSSVDVVISNCVINLSPDKEAVFKEIFRVLKPGGELFFSDVFADRRIPAQIASDPILYGECLGGALYIEDFRRMLRDLGCLDYRVVSNRAIALDEGTLKDRVGNIAFSSVTVRAFKLPSLEDLCEDYGQVAIYRGTLGQTPHAFDLDDHHRFETGRPVLVCGNTAAMLQETRYAPHFQVVGNRATHFGLFDCSSSSKKASEETTGGCC